VRPARELTLAEVNEVRARFKAMLRASDHASYLDRAAVSAADIPVLVAEIERLRWRYADLVGACRAGLLAAAEGNELGDSGSAWIYVCDELSAPPDFHPLSRIIPSHWWGGDPS
jgi:hypothetical protein